MFALKIYARFVDDDDEGLSHFITLVQDFGNQLMCLLFHLLSVSLFKKVLCSYEVTDIAGYANFSQGRRSGH